MPREVQWSELQRDPKSVAALADEGDVHVRRRDGAALLLTRVDRAEASAQGAVLAARALRTLFADRSNTAAAQAMTEALLDEFAWTDSLPKDDANQFIKDFVRAFRASAELGQWALLDQTIREWQATAAIHADNELAKRLSTPIEGDFGPVPRPTDA